MQHSIRKATTHDLEDILRLSQKLFDHEQKFSNAFNNNWTYSKDGKEFFKKHLRKNSSIGFVAQVDGKIIGYIIGNIETITYRVVNPIVEIINLFVEKSYRGRGIGKDLTTKFL